MQSIERADGLMQASRQLWFVGVLNLPVCPHKSVAILWWVMLWIHGDMQPRSLLVALR